MDISWNYSVTGICAFLVLCCINKVDNFHFNGHGLEQNTKWKVEKIQKLNSIKTNILIKMGLSERPFQSQLSATMPPPSKNETVDIKNLPVNEKEDYFAEVQELISLSEPAANITNENIFQFRIAHDSQGGDMEVERANLLVKVKYTLRKKGKSRKRRRKPRTIRLVLRTVDKNGVPDKVVSSLKAIIVKTNWFKMSIPQKLVEETLRSNNPLLKLHIRCKGCKKGAKLVLVHGSQKKRKKSRRMRKLKRRRHRKRRVRVYKSRRRLSKTRPFLLLHTRTKTYIRPKRDAQSICSDYQNNLCCKSPFLFRFSDVGWDDWIISPPSFRTAFCNGMCPSVNQCRETGHSHLRLIYYDQSGAIIISRIPNMVVTSCGCRR